MRGLEEPVLFFFLILPFLSDPGTVVCGMGLSLVPFSDGVLSALARSESLRAILISTGRGE